MDTAVKAVIFGGKARATILDITETVKKAIEIHNLSPVAAVALGRALVAGAYIVCNFKNKSDKLNLIINGNGYLGRLFVSGKNRTVKGFVENASGKNGDCDVGKAVGTDGEFIVIKDLGLKEQYVGKSSLISGQIAEDFAYYMNKSEGVKCAAAFGVTLDENGCRSAGGIVVEALPGADENIVFVLEDIMRDFKNVSARLLEKTPSELMDFHFGHFESRIFEPEPISFYCDCGAKMDNLVRSVGKDEAYDILKTEGKLEIRCDYCAKTYVYDETFLSRLFANMEGSNNNHGENS